MWSMLRCAECKKVRTTLGAQAHPCLGQASFLSPVYMVHKLPGIILSLPLFLHLSTEIRHALLHLAFCKMTSVHPIFVVSALHSEPSPKYLFSFLRQSHCVTLSAVLEPVAFPRQVLGNTSVCCHVQYLALPLKCQEDRQAPLCLNILDFRSPYRYAITSIFVVFSSLSL